MRTLHYLTRMGGCSLAPFLIGTSLCAAPLDNWHPRNPPRQERNILNGVAYGAGYFIAVGNHGEVRKSSDGITWLPRCSGITNDFSAVGYGNGLFVALAGSKILTSTNGDAWAEHDLGTTTPLNGIAFGNGVFIIAGGDLVSLTGTGEQRGVVLTSENGSAWTFRDSGITNSLSAVAFGDGLFVAVGERNSLITSTDGINWTPRDTGTSTFSFSNLPNFYGATHGNGRFVVVGEGAYRIVGAVYLSLTSPDATNWTGHAVERIGSIGNAETGTFRRVSYGESVFVTFGTGFGKGGIYESTDGAHWLSREGPHFVNDLAFGKGVFAAVAGGNCINCEPMTILTSDDGGLNWVSRVTNDAPAALGEDLKAVAYGNGLLVAGGGNRYYNPDPVPLLTSVDGYDWLPRETADAARTARIIYGNNLFWALIGSAVLTSVDAATWVVHDGITASDLRGIVLGNGTAVTVGTAGAVVTSTNGSSWKPRTSGTIRDLTGVAYGNNIFVAAGASGAVVTSADGIEWNYASLALNPSLNDLAFGNGLFAAVGQRGLIMSSTDGVDWTNRVSGTSFNLLGVYFDKGWFVASGEAGTILTSSDAVNWTARDSGTSAALLGAVSMNDTFLVVGDGGTILQSDPLTDTAAHIVRHPRSQTVPAGATLSFEVMASGTSPLAYQWLKGGDPVPNATNKVLAMFNVQSADAGAYSVVVSNSLNSVTSEKAELAVDERPYLRLRSGKPGQLAIYGIEGRSYRIESANDLDLASNWQPLTTTVLTNTPIAFVDTQSTNYARRYYRAVLLPP